MKKHNIIILLVCLLLFPFMLIAEILKGIK